MAVYIFNQNMTEINFCFVCYTLVYLSCPLSRSFSTIWICFILSVAMWGTEEIRYDEFKRKIPTAKIVCSQWNRVLNQCSINRYFQILTVLYLILMSSKSTQKSEHSVILTRLPTFLCLINMFTLATRYRAILSHTVINYALKEIRTQMDILARTNTG